MYSRAGKEPMPFPLQILALCCLGLVALIPRIILANQLDLITDEIIYILAGKSYVPLLRHITTTIGNDGWQFNYEHPPLVKLLIGLSILGNNRSGHFFSELVAARIPSVSAGTVLIMVIYWLGRKPFGHIVAFFAALSLAFSPWLVYFSSIAYLDITMTMFITIAYLLTWYATRRPWLYPCIALFVALGIDSKYTATLIIPGILLFTAYYFFVLRLRLPVAQRQPIPWHWWLMAVLLTPLCLFVVDPVIWPDPLHMLVHSALYEWQHSVGGHLTFLAGSYNLHVPHWTVFYIITNKISAFATIPAAIFIIIALIQLTRLGGAQSPSLRFPPSHIQEATTLAFLLIWLLTTLTMFGLLNIVVGTHYLLPLAPPIVIAGAYTLVSLTRYGIRKIGTSQPKARKEASLFPTSANTDIPHSSVEMGLTPISVNLKVQGGDEATGDHKGLNRVNPSSTHLSCLPASNAWEKGKELALFQIVPLLLLGAIIVAPHLLGLLNTAQAEGYTSEFFHGENKTLQVAYPGYREAVQWLDTHTQGDRRVGLVALPDTLWRGDPNVSWFVYNSNLPKRFQIQEAHPQDLSYPYDYLVWPMHLVQRGYALPPSWHVIHQITGGETTYCYIAVAP